MGLNWNLIDANWSKRHDRQEFAAIETELDKALFGIEGQPEYPLLWRWARLSHFRAMLDFEAGNAAAAIRHFEAGEAEAKKAVGLQPARVEGRFWRGVCLIEAARLRGKFQAAKAVFAATEDIDKSAAIDETYHFAGPLRVQGRIAQAKPLLLGGNLDHALDLYRRALQIAPDNSTNLLYYAEALVSDQHRPTAREVLTKLIAAPLDPAWTWEQERDKGKARKLLQEIS